MKVLHKKLGFHDLFSEILCDPSVQLVGPAELGILWGPLPNKILSARVRERCKESKLNVSHKQIESKLFVQ